MDTAKIAYLTSSDTMNQADTTQTAGAQANTNSPSPLASKEWKNAHQRASHYLYLNQVPIEKQTEILEQIVRKAMRKWHVVNDQDKLISFFIEEVQQYLYPETSKFYQIDNPETPEPHHNMGYLRASTGPNIRRSSIRPAVLEKIPVTKLPVYLSRYKTH